MADLPERVPYHLAIIMDGNGRWAKERGKPRHEGHRAGTENLRRILRACTEFGIKILTIYAFSTENWGRPPAEVAFLMRILETVIDRELNDLHANGVQLRHLGHLDALQDHLQAKVRQAIEKTRNNDRLILNVAFNYGGRDEIVHAVRRIVADGIPAEQVDETLISYYLSTGGQSDPDLIVRTSGEMRVSNFLIWQGAYAEYVVTPTYWPDFDKEELRKALFEFARRERRFGLVEPPSDK
jgi:undecaprenyl diphosphate synthase